MAMHIIDAHNIQHIIHQYMLNIFLPWIQGNIERGYLVHIKNIPHWNLRGSESILHDPPVTGNCQVYYTKHECPPTEQTLSLIRQYKCHYCILGNIFPC